MDLQYEALFQCVVFKHEIYLSGCGSAVRKLCFRLWLSSMRPMFQAMALPPSGPQKTFLNACLKLCRRAAGASTMLPSLVVSALFILLTLVLAHGARHLVERLIKDPFIRLLLQEAIAAAELCGCCFELIIGKYFPNFLLNRYYLVHIMLKMPDYCCLFGNEESSGMSYCDLLICKRK
jgi:hypothetical protein